MQNVHNSKLMSSKSGLFPVDIIRVTQEFVTPRYLAKPYDDPDFDPLLAIHRIRKIEITDRLFEIPKGYDFEKVFNKNFGVIKEEAFKVELEFSGWAAAYVSERIWSPDQKIIKRRDGKTRLTLSTSSEPELISRVLSFGDEAKVIKPKWLVEEVKTAISRMKQLYE